MYMLIYSLFSLIAAFAPNFIWIVIFRFLAGIGLGAEPPLTDIYMGEMIPRHARGRYTAWCYTLGFFGVPLAGFVGRFVVKGSFLGLDGWRWLLIVGSLGALIVGLLRRNLLVYGLGGVILPFVGIKLIDLIVHNLLGA